MKYKYKFYLGIMVFITLIVSIALIINALKIIDNTNIEIKFKEPEDSDFITVKNKATNSELIIYFSDKTRDKLTKMIKTEEDKSDGIEYSWSGSPTQFIYEGHLIENGYKDTYIVNDNNMFYGEKNNKISFNVGVGWTLFSDGNFVRLEKGGEASWEIKQLKVYDNKNITYEARFNILSNNEIEIECKFENCCKGKYPCYIDPSIIVSGLRIMKWSSAVYSANQSITKDNQSLSFLNPIDKLDVSKRMGINASRIGVWFSTDMNPNDDYCDNLTSDMLIDDENLYTTQKFNFSTDTIFLYNNKSLAEFDYQVCDMKYYDKNSKRMDLFCKSKYNFLVSENTKVCDMNQTYIKFNGTMFNWTSNFTTNNVVEYMYFHKGRFVYDTLNWYVNFTNITAHGLIGNISWILE